MLPTLVLAAGLGTRLDPLTRLVAKPAVPLGGRTLIEHLLMGLRHHGIRHVVVNLHHHPESITAAVGDGAALGLSVRYSWEPEVLGSAGGPRHALPLLDADTFFIVNGDTLTDVAMAPLLGAHRRTRAAVTMAVVPNTAPERYGGAVLDEDHGVLGFVPKGRAAGSWHFVGVQAAQASVFAGLEDGLPAESVSGLYPRMIADSAGCVRARPADTPFDDVGTPADYLEVALRRRAAGPGDSAVEPGADVDPSAALERTVVWPGARVGAGARLTGCIVAGDVRVPPGFHARDAAIVPEHVAREGEDVERRDGVALFPISRAR